MPNGPDTPGTVEVPAAELSVRTLGGLVRYVNDYFGAEALDETLDGTGLGRRDFEAGSWASLECIEEVLARARKLFPDDESFKQAFAYRIAESLGPMRFLAWATSPRQLFTRCFNSIDALSSVSHVEVVEIGRSHVGVRYWSDHIETRLMCLSRQGQIGALPTLWGLPPAVFAERACIARGDAYCAYWIRWPERPRAWPLLVGGLAGSAVAIAAATLVGAALPPESWWPLPLVGALVGQIYEHRRTNAKQLDFARHALEAMRELALGEADARRELLELHERQSQWSRALEDQVATRLETTERVLAVLDSERDEHAATLRVVSHDLRNPLSTLVALSWQIRDALDQADPLHRELLEDYRAALQQLEKLVDELVRAAHSGHVLPSNPETLIVADLVDNLKRRLAALARGKDVRVDVLATREAPEKLEVDPLIFDRVVDNLLTNAAKHTEHGTIVLEARGTPGYLTIMICDTGAGIDQASIERIFKARGAPAREAGARGLGVGLPVVVRLMAQIGGRLEIMSRPGVGTTFWAHFPVAPPPTAQDEGVLEIDDLVHKVVNVRHVH